MALARTPALRQHLQQCLAAWPLQAADEAGLRRAAVALVVTDAGHGADLPTMPLHPYWCSDAALVLTRRPETLRRHAGQWALPGGRMDDGETPEQTALRELREEVGLVLTEADVLGRLDTFVTRSGFAMVPVVLWGGDARTMVADPTEVASIHRIPLAELLRADAPILEPLAGSAHPVLKMPVGAQWIAAPTAALLYQFREVGRRGRPRRGAHFEQPLFAWT